MPVLPSLFYTCSRSWSRRILKAVEAGLQSLNMSIQVFSSEAWEHGLQLADTKDHVLVHLASRSISCQH